MSKNWACSLFPAFHLVQNHQLYFLKPVLSFIIRRTSLLCWVFLLVKLASKVQKAGQKGSWILFFKQFLLHRLCEIHSPQQTGWDSRCLHIVHTLLSLESLEVNWFLMMKKKMEYFIELSVGLETVCSGLPWGCVQQDCTLAFLSCIVNECQGIHQKRWRLLCVQYSKNFTYFQTIMQI